jgi:hypothetical protein
VASAGGGFLDLEGGVLDAVPVARTACVAASTAFGVAPSAITRWAVATFIPDVKVQMCRS